jgi:hypothetical protein
MLGQPREETPLLREAECNLFKARQRVVILPVNRLRM